MKYKGRNTYTHEASVLLSKATYKIVNIEASVLKHIVIIYNSEGDLSLMSQ